MTNYKKIGNRYYKIEKNENEVDMVVKATYNSEEDVYRECGRWVKADFDKHETTYDGNTEAEYAKVKSEVATQLQQKG